MEKKKILIIGGGLGGLVCGAILAKEGHSVRILEKHIRAGGGLHTFQRNGVEWETGMHVISGLQPNGALRKLFTYLGIFDKLHIKSANKDAFEQCYVDSDKQAYKMALGRENFIETLGSYFPEEKENIRRYIDKVYQICDDIALFNLRVLSEEYHIKTEYMITSINELIATYTKNPKLQAILGWNNTLYGGEINKTPAYVGALVTQFYIEGSSFFVGGSQQLADALVEVIEKNGGEVLTGNGAHFIDVENNLVQKVIADNGQEYTADSYISAIHTSTMFKLMDISKIQKSYYQRIDNIPNSYSVFVTFITFKPDSFPYLNTSNYYEDDYKDIWIKTEYTDENWPRGCMYLTPPTADNETYAKKMIINAVMNFDTVRQWENTTIGNRGEDYKAFKKHCENKVLDVMEKIYPDFRSKVDKVFCATPLTIRDYYGTKEGAIYGTISDCANLTASHIPIHTKVKNLLLTGQNIILHGILGVPLTSILTCGSLLGLDELLNKINAEGQSQHDEKLS